MLSRVIPVALIILLSIGTGALMAGDLPTAGERFTLRSRAFMQPNPRTPASRSKNPYLWPGVALMAVGAGLIVYGLQTPHVAGYLCPPYQTCRHAAHRSTEIAVSGGVVAAECVLRSQGRCPRPVFIPS